MTGATRLHFPNGQLFAPWDMVVELAESIDTDSWVLVGGLMVQAHAMMADVVSRATKDVDLLIDVFADTTNIEYVISSLQSIGFELHLPGLRGAPFHRLKRNEGIVDVLVADHLPSRKQKASRVGRFGLLEIIGGAQALDRRMEIGVSTQAGLVSFYIPNNLGSLILKAAAYRSDTRDRRRHLDDCALLASLIMDIDGALAQLRGSDRRRINLVNEVLKDPRHPSWGHLPNSHRLRGQRVLRILSS